MRALFTQLYGSSITFTFIHLSGCFYSKQITNETIQYKQSDIIIEIYIYQKEDNTSSDTMTVT